jgi:hypothetical protein
MTAEDAHKPSHDHADEFESGLVRILDGRGLVRAAAAA